ncbi:hypothetical protein [Actinopolymorpha rutila]|uniref:Uncharacterized protein n=1 Tax=Actinopolymorpha rutila TaxID=446787 RepID=A0A852ZG62_9ACTN|nr:hypothetical protein [Actinopolymorpha rutila]NYH91155.1 hypothetical protein [Actinopolymorpha rutila]
MTETIGAVEDNGAVDQQELARHLLAQAKEQGIELVSQSGRVVEPAHRPGPGGRELSVST